MEQLDISNKLVFYVNDKKVELADPNPDELLLDFLRIKLRICGSKYSCGEGLCGACTVIIAKYDVISGNITMRTQNACLTPVTSLHCTSVTTIEGLGSTLTTPHPMQRCLVESHGSQCGYCSPGMVMSMCGLMCNNRSPQPLDIEDAIKGNICRCTGYRSIVDGYKAMCHKDNKADVNIQFPEELKGLTELTSKQTLRYVGERTTWIRPHNIHDLQVISASVPDVQLCAGCSTYVFKQKYHPPGHVTYVDVSHVTELRMIDRQDAGLRVGCAVTLIELQEYTDKMVNTLPEEQARLLQCLLHMWTFYDSPQVKNIATVGGSCGKPFSSSDLNTVLTAADEICGKLRLPIEDYNGHTNRLKDFVGGFSLPFTNKHTYVGFYKQGEFPTPVAAYWFEFVENGVIGQIQKISLVFGGLGKKLLVAKDTMTMMKGRCWGQELFRDAMASLRTELQAFTDEKRTSLALAYFYKLYTDVTLRYKHRGSGALPVKAHITEKSGVQVSHSGCSVKGFMNDGDGPLGQSVPHISSVKHCTGEAQYVDDLPPTQGELHAAMVMSTCAHGYIVSIDTDEALHMPGVVSYISVDDVIGNNSPDAFHNREVFSTKEVLYEGAIIGAVVADSKVEALAAARKVKVTYENLPVIKTIKEAIQAESYGKPPRHLEWGDPDTAMKISDHVITGAVRIGGQRHVYMETQATRAVPTEDGGLEITAGTQVATMMQKAISDLINVPYHKVEIAVQRTGGGFGGKEDNAVYPAGVAAVAAIKLRRTVRCVFTREEDMLITGGRHPYLFKYKVGVTKAGKVLALELMVYANCGYVNAHSEIVMNNVLTILQNSYDVTDIRVTSHLCLTNQHSNTAFRGFGAPQIMLATDEILDHIADELHLPAEQVREIQLNKAGNTLYTGQTLAADYDVIGCWRDALKQANYTKAMEEVKTFNRKNTHVKRGLAIVPTTFIAGLGVVPMHQGGAVLQVYVDGSILLYHGGIEMGQGLNTKVVQVASQMLGIPVDYILIKETSTDVTPNSTGTFASLGSDFYCTAVKDACEKLIGRLKPHRVEGMTWRQLVKSAYKSRVEMTVTGYYKPDIGHWDHNKMQGELAIYHVTGAGCSLVELDCLTGAHKVLKADVVMDIGRSLNPAVDIGQIEGAFVQGYGLFMMEDEKYSPGGSLISRTLSKYHVPRVADIPDSLNVTIRDATNPKGVFSSRCGDRLYTSESDAYECQIRTSKVDPHTGKAVGEPALSLATSVFFATKMAIKSAREDAGMVGYFRLDSPATPEQVMKVMPPIEGHITKS